MTALADAERFEEAADVRDRAEALGGALRRQRHVERLRRRRHRGGRAPGPVPHAEVQNGVPVAVLARRCRSPRSAGLDNIEAAASRPRPNMPLRADLVDEIVAASPGGSTPRPTRCGSCTATVASPLYSPYRPRSPPFAKTATTGSTGLDSLVPVGPVLGLAVVVAVVALTALYFVHRLRVSNRVGIRRPQAPRHCVGSSTRAGQRACIGVCVESSPLCDRGCRVARAVTKIRRRSQCSRKTSSCTPSTIDRDLVAASIAPKRTDACCSSISPSAGDGARGVGSASRHTRVGATAAGRADSRGDRSG